MGILHFRQRPRNTSHERTGSNSHQDNVCWQCTQCDLGRTTDSWRGTRYATTFANEPKTSP
ncbi:hypothetical protein Alches_21130 [Alicyclobacillus hesperidum subsp. aegles]|nr:hypothetical protein Alches_21130 [Alicyclobacillus hesperidum subsp. aegles]